jgi:hypothetical protein
VYAIRRVRVNQDGLKENGTRQLLVYADEVVILGGSVHTIKKNNEALVGTCKENGLEVNADKGKYMVMFRDQETRRSLSIKIDNISFDRLEQFKYLGKNLTFQNSLRK